MQDKIIAAIAAYLDEATTTRTDRFENFLLEFKAPITGNYKEYLEKLATELSASIAPLVDVGEVGEVDWKNAPEWAEWQTIDRNGQVTFWEKQPYAHLLSGYWVDDAGGNREYRQVDSWQYKSQQRPK